LRKGWDARCEQNRGEQKSAARPIAESSGAILILRASGPQAFNPPDWPTQTLVYEIPRGEAPRYPRVLAFPRDRAAQGDSTHGRFDTRARIDGSAAANRYKLKIPS
jgi:hypothetical protein